MTMVSDFRSHKKEKKNPPPPLFFFFFFFGVRFGVRYGLKYGTSILETVRMYGVRNYPSGCTEVRSSEQQNACSLPSTAKDYLEELPKDYLAELPEDYLTELPWTI